MKWIKKFEKFQPEQVPVEPKKDISLSKKKKNKKEKVSIPGWNQY